MSLPRRVNAGTTHMVTRRCSERRFLLTPDAVVTQVFTYVLALAAAKYGVLLHSVIVMANHFHAMVTDPDARLPDFMQHLDMLVGRALNCHRHRGENFWGPGTYSNVEVHGEESAWEKLVYVTCNAVRAGLVRDPLDWPGLRTTPSDGPGQRLRALRPSKFFRKSMPDEAAVFLTKPPALAHLSDAEYRREFERRVAAEVKKVRQERKKAGKRKVLGVRAILAQDPFATAGSTVPTFKTDPRISAKGQQGQEIKLLQAWRQRYRECWESWRHGMREVLFPAGTYWMRVAFGVRCEAVPDG